MVKNFKYMVFILGLLTLPDIIPKILTGWQISASINLFQACIYEAGLPADTVVTPQSNSTLYSLFNHQMNLRLPPSNPPAIVFPRSTRDVQVAVRCGVISNIHMVVRSGGHSSEAISSGTQEIVVLDFHHMHQININKNAMTVEIEPGNTLGKIYWTLWNEGGFGIPLGTCYSVGIGGFIMGGGFGFYSSLYGYGVDSVIEFTMVDANGNVRLANNKQNTDLYWALRGVGSGYIGIVTSFTFKMFQANDLKLTDVSFFYELDKVADILDAWQSWVTWARIYEPTAFSFISIQGGQLFVFVVQALENSSPKTNQEFLKKINETFPPDGNMEVTSPIVFVDLVQKVAQANLAGGKIATWDDLQNLKNNQNQQVYQKTKSFYVDSKYKRVYLEKIASVLRRMPSQHMELTLLAVFGAAASPSPNATAYVHRKYLYYFSYEYTNPENDEAGRTSALGWMDEFTAATEFMNNGRTYQNDVDYDMNDQLERYYGENLPRLIQIKSKWDSQNYFHNPVSIPTLGGMDLSIQYSSLYLKKEQDREEDSWTYTLPMQYISIPSRTMTRTITNVHEYMECNQLTWMTPQK